MNSQLARPEVLRGEVLIGGRWYDKPEHLESWNPATGELLGSVPLCNREDVSLAVAAARGAQPAWTATPLAQRLDILRSFSELLAQEADAVAALITLESGKPIQEANTADVIGGLEFLAGLVREAPRALASRRAALASPVFFGKTQRIYRAPLGVAGVISPWNLPLAIPLGQVALALAAGNTVVLKPSEHTPLVAVKLATLLHRVGIPPGVFNLVTGDDETGSFLAGSAVDVLLFTGDFETGSKIRTAAAARNIPYSLELGGKDAFLVLPDAPLERTLNAALWNGCFGTGQACSSSERYFVPRAMFSSFVEKLAQRASTLRMGDGSDPSVQLGPLISAAQREKVAVQVEDARAGGAKILCGGEIPEGPGYFYPATVVAGPPRGCALLNEETFGPVIAVVPYDDLEEAIGWCNDSPYGLSASVWTSDTEAGQRVAARLEVGTVWINEVSYTHSSISCPWGGTKGSGSGRTRWWGTLHDLTFPKLICVDSGKKRRELWWYPYTSESLALVRESRTVFWGNGLDRVGAAARAAVLWLRRGGP